MRDCRRSGELRDALAAEERLAPDLAAHVAGCAACTRVAAAANRFDSSLDAAMAGLVTDALPPSTAAVARTAPPASRGWSAPRILASAVVTIALGAFAAVGVVAMGASVSDAILDGSTRAGAQETPHDTADCAFSEPDVEVIAVGDAASAGDVIVAYCLETVPSQTAAGDEAGVTCVRFVGDLGSHASIPLPSPTRSGGTIGAAYLGACTYAESRPVASDAPDAGASLAPTAPFASWDEASLATAWPVLRPHRLPDGYDLVSLQGFAPGTDPEAIESVFATYLRHGTPLIIDEFLVDDADALRIELTVWGDELDGVTTGRTTVNGHAAFWAVGPGIQTGGGPGGETETIVLTWSDGRVGYRIAGKDVDLDDLRRVATSLDDG